MIIVMILCVWLLSNAGSLSIQCTIYVIPYRIYHATHVTSAVRSPPNLHYSVTHSRALLLRLPVPTEMTSEQTDPLCTHHVVNDDLSSATSQFSAIIRRELASDNESGSGSGSAVTSGEGVGAEK